MKMISLCVSLANAAIALCTVSIANAQTRVSYGSVFVPGGEACSKYSDTEAVVASCSYSTTQGGAVGGFRAGSEAGHTAVAVAAVSHTTTAGYGPGADSLDHEAVASAATSFSDVVVISRLQGDSESGEPQIGTLTYRVKLHADLSGSLSAAPAKNVLVTSLSATSWELAADIGVVAAEIDHHFIRSGAGTRLDVFGDGASSSNTFQTSFLDNQEIDSPFDTFVFATNFQFGQPFSIGLDLRLTAYAQTSGEAIAVIGMDATRSLDWGGIALVTVDGKAVPYEVASASGFDYATAFAPVPEPRSVVLWSAGLLGMVLGKRGKAVPTDVRDAPRASARNGRAALAGRRSRHRPSRCAAARG